MARPDARGKAGAPRAAERRFVCTACGQCCHGLLPLTLDDALAHAGRFPLAMIWTPVRQGSKAFAVTARLGTTLRLPDRRQVAIRVGPAAYLPPTVACPALAADGRCAIHDDKPTRCKTMPFSPHREENDQADLLIPRPGWACDTTAAAPVVYRAKAIVDRADFDRERRALLATAADLGGYADFLMTITPGLAANVIRAAMKPTGGHVVVNFASVLPRLARIDAQAFARSQHPVLVDFASRTGDHPEYQARYREWAADLEPRL